MATQAQAVQIAPNKVLQAALWTAQVLLAAAFAMAGITKGITPISELATKMGWVTTAPEGLVRFIAVAELAGALGLILPAATRIKPWLTPLAALGLLTIMVLACGLHISRGELGALPINALLGGLAAFIAWGRGRRLPITPR